MTPNPIDQILSDSLDSSQKNVSVNTHTHRVSGVFAKNADSLWGQCLAVLSDNVSDKVFQTWFAPIKALTWENNALTVQVPSQFFYEWIEEHHSDLLKKTVAKVMGTDATLNYEVVVQKTVSAEQRTSVMKLPGFREHTTPPVQGQMQFDDGNVAPAPVPSFLNPRYHFNNFIKGDSNQLACAAAQAVAENPGGTQYNPLVLYGDTGLGKTHLVHAIGNAALSKNPDLKVIYTNSERFTVEFVNAVQNNKSSEFTRMYRNVDILIVDDIQFFARKERTQDSFFHTFNALQQAGKQIILTSDVPPSKLEGVTERLISRFQWGLTADVQIPDFEMRMAILQRKALDEGSELPPDVVEYIARNVTTSVRELEGCLISLLAKTSLEDRPMDLELAQEVVGGVVSKLRPRELSIEAIREKVAAYYSFKTEELTGKSRKHQLVVARQAAMFLSKQLTGSPLKMIGAYFGNRDHTTVIHACRSMENYLDTNAQIKSELTDICQQLGVGLPEPGA